MHHFARMICSCLLVASSSQLATHAAKPSPGSEIVFKDIDISSSPSGLIKELLDRSILANHARPRKSVSSQSVVDFKSKKSQLKRQYTYPSNWGKFVLYCKSGWLIQVLPNGAVNGTNDMNSPYAILQVQILSPTIVRIKGIKSGRYIAINSRGKLISKRYPTRETVFHEEVLENYYHTLKSNEYPKTGAKGWYVAIRRNGSRKRASKTKLGESCIQFLKVPMAVKSEWGS